MAADRTASTPAGMARKRRLEPWPIGLALALLAMMAVGVAFLLVAQRNPDALVVEDAYRAGLALNQQIREERRAAALGVQLELTVLPAPGAVGLRVQVRDARGRPVEAERVTVRRERPAEGGLDAELELERGGDGYRGRLALPRPGRWRLVVTAVVEGHPVVERFAVEGA